MEKTRKEGWAKEGAGCKSNGECIGCIARADTTMKGAQVSKLKGSLPARVAFFLVIDSFSRFSLQVYKKLIIFLEIHDADNVQGRQL